MDGPAICWPPAALTAASLIGFGACAAAGLDSTAMASAAVAIAERRRRTWFMVRPHTVHGSEAFRIFRRRAARSHRAGAGIALRPDLIKRVTAMAGRCRPTFLAAPQ